MKRLLAGAVLVVLLGGASQGCIALGVAAAAGGIGGEAGWFFGKWGAKETSDPHKEKTHDASAAH